MAYETHRTNVRSAGASAGWFLAGALLVALIGLGLYTYNGGFANDNKVSIELEVPNVDVPKVELPKVELPELQSEPMRTPTIE